MTAYYNEIDAYAAEWLRNLIRAGHIASGDVDERDIRDVRAADLRGYTQCHFFAGIGGWSYALRLAGWDDDRPVWTGSCPCQPFSAAGEQGGFDDERHLWPDWFSLVRQCRPTIVFGEQVDRATFWYDQVSADLETEGYAIAAADIPAAGLDAWHARQRLYFVAHADGDQLRHEPGRRSGTNGAGATIPRNDGKTRPAADIASVGRREVSGDVASSAGFTLAGYDPSRLSTAWRAWPAEPNVGRVVHGLPNRVDQIRGLGNAIVPAVAAEFIVAADEAINR